MKTTIVYDGCQLDIQAQKKFKKAIKYKNKKPWFYIIGDKVKVGLKEIELLILNTHTFLKPLDAINQIQSIFDIRLQFIYG